MERDGELGVSPGERPQQRRREPLEAMISEGIGLSQSHAVGWGQDGT
jgi:hypothetical protein